MNVQAYNSGDTTPTMLLKNLTCNCSLSAKVYFIIRTREVPTTLRCNDNVEYYFAYFWDAAVNSTMY